MKKTTTYAVIDTVIGTVIGTGLDAEEATQCIFLHTEGSTHNGQYETHEETVHLVTYLYELAADVYSDGEEAWAHGDDQGSDQCRDQSDKLLDIAVELEEIYGQESVLLDQGPCEPWPDGADLPF